MEPAILRRAGDLGAAAITSLVGDAYAHYEPLIGRTPIPMLADYALADREHDVWVLERVGRLVGVALEVLHLLEHRAARHVDYAADDHAARLAAGVEIDGGHHVGESHRAPL